MDATVLKHAWKAQKILKNTIERLRNEEPLTEQMIYDEVGAVVDLLDEMAMEIAKYKESKNET